MNDERTLEVKTGSEYRAMLEATAQVVKDWPDWKTGEYESSAFSSEEHADGATASACKEPPRD